MNRILLIFLLLFPGIDIFPNSLAPTSPPDTTTEKSQWFNNIQIRGYAQVRYNRLLETNPDLQCEQCDRSWGRDGGFFLRRARIIFFGQVHPRVYFYIQPDFASSNGEGQNFGQLRDLYFDIGIDRNNEFRFRIGQSKVPFGFENLQSSQNRLALDRNDAINSAFSNERDIGVFFYWAPGKIRDRFSMLVRDGYKGSGDYGVFGFGVFNGQTANQVERNDDTHVVARVTYPFLIGNQIIETSLQGYSGNFELAPNQLSEGVRTTSEDFSFRDQRVAATVILYPKPFGFQAEYNVGEGPEFNPATSTIETQKLEGGYVTVNYRQQIKNQFFYPFVRYQYYDGGKKHERDARSYTVRELECGLEWLPNPHFELVVMYTMSSRRFEDFQNPHNRQEGNLLRIQAQMNF